MPERRRRERVLTAQLVIMEVPEVAGRVRAWAEVRDDLLAEVLRQCVRAGLEKLEPRWIKEHGGELDPAFLAAHVTASVKERRVATGAPIVVNLSDPLVR
jgi:hypothetical protein